LKRNRKGIQRVMQRYGIRPYRRRGRKWRTKKATVVIYANLLMAKPAYPNHVWAADFTELSFKGRVVFVATVIDLFTREVRGVAVALRRGVPLTLQALGAALLSHPRPLIFHSDNGKEYAAQAFVRMLEEVGSLISRSHPGCPWENGYQESFYDKFKVDLGDPNRFCSLGELVAQVYRTVWEYYNHTRIHSALKMPPSEFARKHALGIVKSVS
jgi:transposase InsO family protein